MFESSWCSVSSDTCAIQAGDWHQACFVQWRIVSLSRGSKLQQSCRIKIWKILIRMSQKSTAVCMNVCTIVHTVKEENVTKSPVSKQYREKKMGINETLAHDSPDNAAASKHLQREEKSPATNLNTSTQQKHCPTRKRKKYVQFNIKAWSHVRNDDVHTAQIALTGKNEKKGCTEMDREGHTLEEMQSWYSLFKPKSTKVLSPKFFLKCKRTAEGNTKNYKVRVVLLGNENMKNDENMFSPVPDFTVLKIMMCLTEQKSCYHRHFNLQSALSEQKLEIQCTDIAKSNLH